MPPIPEEGEVEKPLESEPIEVKAEGNKDLERQISQDK